MTGMLMGVKIIKKPGMGNMGISFGGVMSFRKLKNIILIIYISVIVLFTIGTTFIYQYTKADMQNTAINSQRELTKQYSGQIDTLLANMDNIALLVLKDPLVLQKFSEVDQDKYNNFFDKQINSRILISNILQNFYTTNKAADRISIYNDKSDYVSYGILYESNDMIRKFLKNTKVDEQIQSIMDTPYEKRIVNIEKDSRNNQQEDLIILRRVLTDIGTGRTYGLIEVQQRLGNMKKLLNIDDEMMQVYLLDDKKNVIFSNNAEWNQQLEKISANNKNGSLLTFTNTKNSKNENVLVTSCSGKEFGWTVMVVQPEQVLLKGFFQLSGYIWAFVVGFILINLLLFIFVTKKLLNPLQDLNKSVKNVNIKNMSMNLENNSKLDEITQINLEFQRMFERLNRAMKNEISYQFNALQAQMNPHFIYNSLSVISAEAIEENTEKIPELCNALAQMLRYSADYEKRKVTLREELNYCKDYLKLMKERYVDRVDYKIKVSGDLDSVQIAKITLQPLLENCFKHGFQNKEFPWKIMVEVCVTDDTWRTKIIDNGNGMKPDEIQKLKSRLDHLLSSKQNFHEYKVGGLGLVSTIYRMKLLNHGKVYYDIRMEPEGFCVEIGGDIYDPSYDS